MPLSLTRRAVMARMLYHRSTRQTPNFFPRHATVVQVLQNTKLALVSLHSMIDSRWLDWRRRWSGHRRNGASSSDERHAICITVWRLLRVNARAGTEGAVSVRIAW